ncbi:MAG: NIPSNAP family protein [Acidobacteriota bacterium]
MNRREFSLAAIATSAAGISGNVLAQDDKEPAFYELRTYELRSDLPVAKFRTFLEKSYLPVVRPLVSGPIGVFEVVTGQDSPAVILLLQYDSPDKLPANSQLASKADQSWKDFVSSGMPYVRYRSELLRAFEGQPRIVVPAERQSGHLFELRTYESKNALKAAAKVDMFNTEEMKIFRACEMPTVFFGEALIGQKLPHLTYMLAFDDMAARETAWARFGSNPDWNRIKDDPRWVDTVSSIHASFLRPASFSEIR